MSRILTFGDLRMVNDPTPLADLEEFFQEISKKFPCNCVTPDLFFRDLSEMWIVLG